MLLTGLGVVGALAFTRTRRPVLYAVAKAAASAGFLWTALAVGAPGSGWSRWAFAALVMSAFGDVALTIRNRKGFLLGLVFFALAHGVYAVAFTVRGFAIGTAALAAALALIVVMAAWRAFGGQVPEPLRAPVVVYLVIIAAMLATGSATAVLHRSWALGIGAVLAAGSDLAVARERFGTRGFVNKVVGLPTYYLGQTLIALSLMTP